ncbi:MAG: hypothetical protein MJ178_10955, partial [Treponemataceae bacterium]|nr:hypothetical protein [Treponemataceae bacterium]
MYTFKPVLFYVITLVSTWAFWIAAAVLSHMPGDTWYGIAMAFMFLGLIVPCVVAFCFVKKSGSKALQADYKEKIFGFFRINLWNVLLAMAIFALVIFTSIIVSLLFG